MSAQKAGKYACYEFERKFLLKELPESLKNSLDHKETEDRYFDGTNLRLRIVRSPEGVTVARKLTQKYVPEGSDLSKTSITNIYLSESEMNLFSLIPSKLLRKMRYIYHVNNQTFSVDKFEDALEGLIITEIEFESEAEMKKLTLPFADWIEVTHDTQYSGGNLAAKSEHT